MSHSDTNPGSEPAITADDVCSTAGRLIGRHGREALEIARFLAEENRLSGDSDRAAAWHAVGSLVADILAVPRLQDRTAVH